jgi:hypothetical protein
MEKENYTVGDGTMIHRMILSNDIINNSFIDAAATGRSRAYSTTRL